MISLSTAAGASRSACAVDHPWRRQLAALAVAATVLLTMFGADLTDLARLWWTSTTFGHCLFIGPVIGWLVWQRRSEVARLVPVAWAPGLLLVALGGAAWLSGDAAGVALARHIGLVVMLQGAVVTTLGPNVARGLLFPLCYALFLVPCGESLEHPLQQVTVAMTMGLLHLAGIPARVDGVLITIPHGYFEIAEACSGAKFVIAMIAYATLVANVAFVSWLRRGAFMVVSLIVPIIANGIRAFATIAAAYLTSVARATGIDHIVFGWIFFGLVMAAVLALGWRWFDRAPDAPAFDPAGLQSTPSRRLAAPTAVLLIMLTAALFPLWSQAVSARTTTLPAHIDLPVIDGWHRVPMSVTAPWTPSYPRADHFLIGRYADALGDAVDLSIAVFGDQREGKEIVGFGIGALREDDVWVRIGDLADVAGGSAIAVTAPHHVEREIVTWYRVGDIVTHDPRLVKLETLRTRLLGGPQRAVAIHVSAERIAGRDAVASIDTFLRALGPIDRLADQSAGLDR